MVHIAYKLREKRISSVKTLTLCKLNNKKYNDGRGFLEILYTRRYLMVTTDTIHMLEDKIQFIHQDGKDIYLVGPIKLPINLYGETKVFQWYSWLQCSEGTNSVEGIIEKLSSINLADMQQSSVLVYVILRILKMP